MQRLNCVHDSHIELQSSFCTSQFMSYTIIWCLYKTQCVFCSEAECMYMEVCGVMDGDGSMCLLSDLLLKVDFFFFINHNHMLFSNLCKVFSLYDSNAIFFSNNIHTIMLSCAATNTETNGCRKTLLLYLKQDFVESTQMFSSKCSTDEDDEKQENLTYFNSPNQL